MMEVKTLEWKDDKLILIDCTKLPIKEEYIICREYRTLAEAIKILSVRGAPAIGIAAAYGLYVSIRDLKAECFEEFYKEFEKNADYLASSRPTAVNLFWALNRMKKRAIESKNKSIEDIKRDLLNEAHAIRNEDEEMCKAIGENFLTLLEDGMTILTHCNAGGLATARYGTALSPIFLAKDKGWNIRVFADETRPLLQGARLTTWELLQYGVDVTLICDNMAAHVMSKGWIDAIITGCDRVAANGDVANKIGTYGLAVLAKAHNIPFYIAAPSSTIDMDTPDGSQIVIEERSEDEVSCGFGIRTAPEGVKVYNPAFDVTPNSLITAIVTEKGILRPPYDKTIKNIF